MKFTDLFIKRPVLATVISLLILIAGVRSLGMLEVRQYPVIESTVVKVTTSYPGASSDLVKGFVTTPLQQAIAEANGIDYLFSSSTQGTSTIEAHMVLNYDANAAVAEIQAKVASQRNVLPADAQDPVIESSTGDSTALMYVAFFSEDIPRAKLADYVIRVVQPQLQALPGVAKARMFGQQFAMRIWLDPQRMAALGVTADDVANVLRANNYLAGVGSTKGKYVAVDLTASTDVSEPEDFRRLVVRGSNGTLVRLDDIARTELGAENYDSTAWYKGIPAVFIAVEQAPGANPLTVAGLVNDEIPKIREQLPEGMQVQIPYDASAFIQDSINEVYRTIIEAVVIVLFVVYLTLGSFRAAAVPAVAVPLSLIGGAFVMLLLGYSLNLLTLLSMVLAIGLVVDDAIIVVENVHRHIEHGESKFQAAINGAREMAVPIIAMTTTLLAVYAPIGFMGGLVGTLFTEFAFTLTGAVIISGIVALTLSPVLSSHVLKPHGSQGRFEQRVEAFFNWLSNGYRRLLHSSLSTVSVSVVFAVLTLPAIYLMFITSQNELAPTEDQGIIFFQATGPRTATLDYHEAYARQIQEQFQQFPEYNDSFYILGMTQDTVFGGFKMKSISKRERTQMEIQPQVQGALDKVAGFQTVAFPRPSLPGSAGGLPVQFVITSDRSYEEIAALADQLIGRGMGSGNFMFLKKSVDIDRPVTRLLVDRDRAGDLGITMDEIGRNLANLLGGGYVNRFSLEGRSYKVIPQVEREFRLDERMLDDYYIRTGGGDLVPLASVISMERSVEPSKRTQFQQLNSVSVEGVMFPGVKLGDALNYLETQARELFPKGYSYDYAGDSRQYAQQGSGLIVTFFLSLLVIYLVLAAQFESWKDPLIILISVPLSIAGAMVFITLGLASVNIYTQVGLITLIGVVAKNGILIVEFANQLQIREGLSKREAVERAASIRLRPILMTAVALIVAMFPLLTASGPGAVSRFDIGLTITTGLGIGTFFTLFVLPAFYLLLARDHAKAEEKLHAEEQRA
ncbi:efflux RND transporter permease subunit [Thioalbus denitrificans]|uniref:Multidrug efflux pump n=1 Tax=Thioalbus denitrificans TaxID=547122 RepID=A0A369CDL2_9GAMM|nr:efflux RND transporter permease subunit [Thioalbus denitrificans]RCX32132.1 multidrug efflux pump [Thioalbus denitrificans]